MKPVDHIIDTSRVDLTAIARQFGTPLLFSVMQFGVVSPNLDWP